MNCRSIVHDLTGAPPSSSAWRRCWVFSLLLLCLSLAAGCGRQDLDRTWGANTYPSRATSLNGLGYFERLCIQKGARFKEVNRLSPRLDRVDCLLLIGDTMHPPAKEARDWIEEWLAEKSGRKVICFGRDFDAAEHYMRATLDQQSDERRVRAGLDLAEVRAERDDVLYEQMNADVFCRWFYIRVSKPQRVLTKFSGPWSQGLSGNLRWPVRAYYDWSDPELKTDQPNWTVVPTPNTAFLKLPKPFRTGRTPPAVPTGPKPTNTNRSVFTSYWEPSDIGSAEEWDSEWESAPDAEQLLVAEDGTPLVMRLTSQFYPDSEILTVANGAPLFNGMMIDPDLRMLCGRIADEIGQSRVAYLRYDATGIQVSEIPDLEDEVAGLSVLMTWPLNILMAHLAFLGVLICIALFPILGRPQNLKTSNVSDFGQHAEAMGHWLQRTRDWPFALRLVADYLRIVRGESLPAWLQTELANHTAPDPKSLAPQPPPQLGHAQTPNPASHQPGPGATDSNV